MPIVTQIIQQKKRANRRSVYLDGTFAFGCNLNVVARFKLHEGLTLTPDEVVAIEQGEVRQECFDKAIRFISIRLHGRSELRTKLMRQEIGATVIDSVLDQLTELGYINDAAFSAARAGAAAKYKRHGPNRARMDLAKKGVDRETARQAVESVYEAHDSMAVARDLAAKKAPSLRRLEPHVAKRRLYGLLLRRGFDCDTIKPVVEEVLGAVDEPAD